MGVDVPDGLPRLRAGIEDDPVAGIRDALGDGDIMSVPDHLGQQTVPRSRQLAQVGVMGARDNEYVYRCLRIDVTECDGPGAAGHYGRGNIGCGDATEQAIGHGADLNGCRGSDACDIYDCSTAKPRSTTPLVQRSRQLLAVRRPAVSHARALLRGMKWAWGGVHEGRRAGAMAAPRDEQ